MEDQQTIDQRKIQDNEFANEPAENTPDIEEITREIEGGHKKRGFFKSFTKVFLVFVGILLLGGASFAGYRVYEKITFKRTILSLLPADTEYFARVTIDKNHSQVKLAGELVNKFPGVEKLAEQIKPFLNEILSQPLDPFEPIFSLADKEIFLAKVSQRNEGVFLDQLVNIIEVDDPSKIAKAGQALKDDENIALDSYTYKGKQISHATLSEMGNLQFEQFLGPIPYQLTIPFSKEAYFTDFDNFLVSADKKADIEDIVSLVDGQSKLYNLKGANHASILEEKSFKNLVGRLPQSYLFEFYQKQKAVPNVTQFPGEFGSGFIIMESLRTLASAMPFNSSIFSEGQFSPRIFAGTGLEARDDRGFKLQSPYTASITDNLGSKINELNPFASSEKENIHDLKVGRAFTLTAQNEGIDFITIQEQYDLSLAQFFGARKLMFNSADSLADKIPSVIAGGEMGIWFEIENLAGQIEFAEKLLDQLINDAPDEETKRVYRQQRDLINEAFGELQKGLFEGSEVTRDDLMEVLKGRFAFYLAPKFGGASPAGGIILQGGNTAKVEEVFGKISFEGAPTRPASDYERQSDLNQIRNSAEVYYSENKMYPATIADAVPTFMSSPPTVDDWVGSVGTDPDTGELYNYVVSDGGQSYWVEATLSDGTKLVATTGAYPMIPSLPKTQIQAVVAEEYNGVKIYSLSQADLVGSEEYNLFWLIGPDIAIFSIGKNSDEIKAVYDFYTSPDSALSLESSDAFRFEKARTPGNVLMLSYIKPYSFWGLAEYIYKLAVSQISTFGAPRPQPATLDEAAGPELSFVIKSYLKTMDHLYGYTSGDMDVITSSLFFRIKDLPEGEKAQAELYVDDLLAGRAGPLKESQAQARNVTRAADLTQLSIALELYRDDNASRSYPIIPTPSKILSAPGAGGELEVALVPQYIASLPQDPLISQGFYYEYASPENGQDYLLTARLEEPYNEYQCDRTITQAVCILSIRSKISSQTNF